jgi:hypothetical protein
VTQVESNVTDNAHVFRGHRTVILASIALWVSAPAAFASDSDTYLSNVYQDDPHDWSDPWRDSSAGQRNNASSTDGHVGEGVRVSIDAGEHFGTAMRWRFEDNGFSEPDELWFRYYLRFPEGFTNVGKGKLPGPAGLYSSSARGNIPSTPSQPGWSARMLFSPTYDGNDTDHTTIGYYLYHLDQEQAHGDLLLWDDEVASLEHGNWYCVEGYVQMNTPGEADGVLAGWVDGVEAFNRADVRLRREAEPYVGIESFWFDVYFGGRDPTPVDLAIDFDSLAFGQQRLGCDDWSDRGFTGGFFDDEGSVHESDIEALLAAGVINGCSVNGTAYCPDDPVTRGQMAKILVRALDLPASSVDYFTDDDGSIYEDAINSLADLGITNGCGEQLYCPDAVMNRAQAAAFLDRALELPRATGEHFADIGDSPYASEVNAMAEAGLTSGCGDGLFCPNAVASRSQTASFVARAMDLQAQRALADERASRRPLVRINLLSPRVV